MLGGRPAPTILVSVHSFTPELRGQRRELEVGVLYDDHVPLAGTLADAIAATGLVVRHNEPYSGLDGLIYSARVHGTRFGLRYVEIEVNNGLLARRRERRVGRRQGRRGCADRVDARLSTAPWQKRRPSTNPWAR